MIIDDDGSDTGNEAEGAFADVEAERIVRDASLHNTFATSELTSEPTKSIDASSP